MKGMLECDWLFRDLNLGHWLLENIPELDTSTEVCFGLLLSNSPTLRKKKKGKSQTKNKPHQKPPKTPNLFVQQRFPFVRKFLQAAFSLALETVVSSASCCGSAGNVRLFQ